MCKVLLLAVATEDRIKVFGDRLSMRARKLLKKYEKSLLSAPSSPLVKDEGGA